MGRKKNQKKVKVDNKPTGVKLSLGSDSAEYQDNAVQDITPIEQGCYIFLL
jgi:hypothetical protein